MLVNNIPPWFTISPIRRNGYDALRKKHNDPHSEEDKNCPKIYKSFCKTRWLETGPVLVNISSDIIPLREYFKQCATLQDGELKVNKAKAINILEDLNRFETELYLAFLISVIPGFEEINKSFQASKKIDFARLCEDMKSHFEALKWRFMREGNPLNPQHILNDYGNKFNAICTRVLKEAKDKFPDKPALGAFSEEKRKYEEQKFQHLEETQRRIQVHNFFN